MGADIYLRSKSEPSHARWEPLFNAAVKRRDAFPRGSVQQEEIQKEVSEIYENMFGEGYFRDSYNATSLLWVLGISWWNDVGKMLNKKSMLPIGCAKALRQRVLDAPLTLETVTAYCKEHKLEQDTPEEWFKYFSDKRQEFVALLDQSIALKEPLDCSI